MTLDEVAHTQTTHVTWDQSHRRPLEPITAGPTTADVLKAIAVFAQRFEGPVGPAEVTAVLMAWELTARPVP